MDRTPPLKPQVPAIPSLPTINYLNKTVSGSFTPHPKLDTLVVPASSCNSVQPNGYATSQPASHLSSDKQLRVMPSSNNPAFGTAGVVTSSVTPTSTTVTSSLTVPAVQPWELKCTTARLLSRDSTPLFFNLVVSNINPSHT